MVSANETNAFGKIPRPKPEGKGSLISKFSVKMDWAESIRKIWEQDGEFQSIVVRHTLQEIRKVKDEWMLDLELASAKRDGLFFVPDDEYLRTWFGERALDAFAGLYTQSGLCRYAHRLAIPITDFAGRVPGLIGYSNARVYEAPDEAFVKYQYPPDLTLSKGRYMYCTASDYQKAMEDGYICIVDGIFDKRRLTDYGFNAVSLMGSVLTSWHKLYLSKIPHIIVVRDNDNAGYELLQKCKHAFKHRTIEIAQGEEWDIDDFLKTSLNMQKFKDAFQKASRSGFLHSEFIRRPMATREENLIYAQKEREIRETKDVAAGESVSSD